MGNKIISYSGERMKRLDFVPIMFNCFSFAYVLLLNDAVSVNHPNLIVGVLEILKSVSKLRSGGGFCGSRSLLDCSGGIYKVKRSVEVGRCVA